MEDMDNIQPIISIQVYNFIKMESKIIDLVDVTTYVATFTCVGFC
jgi:hypothetical protein